MSGTYSRLLKPLEPAKGTTEAPKPVTSKSSKPKKAIHSTPERATKRVSHDLYIDQMETLSTKTRAYFLMKGKNKTVVQMLREAIDGYISRHQ